MKCDHVRDLLITVNKDPGKNFLYEIEEVAVSIICAIITHPIFFAKSMKFL